MISRWHITLTALIILMAISACSSPNNSANNPTQLVVETAPQPYSEPQPLPQQPSVDSGGIKRGEAAKWPDYIPDDIPVLEGKIRMVMEAPESHIRIFYENLTRDQINQYLRLLEQKGFKLEYIVYVQEGFPDNSEERLKKGDFDAVDITKGEYHMNIGYGEGEITYDIYTTGFAEKIPTSAGLDWPADLVNVVPKPERCPIVSTLPDSSGGYQITCRPADDDVVADYTQSLQTAGYLPRESIIVSPSEVYGRGDLDITVKQASTALVLINISNADLSKTTWPSELTGIVPEPKGCLLTNVLKSNGGGYSITCDGEGEQIRLDYINLLLSDGFSETDRMESQSGELISVHLEKGSLRLALLLGSFPGMVLEISGIQ